ncbi:EAL domain-containing protein [Motiliproteus sp. SC1-56]|uniref:bifunctional diguanylate cyclase/phosphodiesterase n=1 Tax=Motiliproteus sp. SC1-56 TaxID=2799565 RepID=UPI001A8D6504|nr:EAL domain-containing protein [Motiliproteus sp. SC1-56]
MRNILILLTILALTADVLIEWQLSRQYRNEQKLQVVERASRVRAQLEGTLNSNLYLVQGLASALAVNPQMSQEAFRTFAAELFGYENQLRNVAAAPDLVIRYVYPLQGNEGALGLDFRRTPSQRETALRAKETGKVVLAGPLELAQGGRGLIARMPVFTTGPEGSKRFWGLVSAVLDLEQLYPHTGLWDDELALALRGRDGDRARGTVFFGEPALFADEAVLLDISLPSGAWQLAAKPKEGWKTLPSEVWWVRITLLALLLLSAWLLLQRHQQQRALQLRNAKFSATFNESPLGMTIARLPSTQLLETNDAFTELTGHSRQACLERPIHEALQVDKHQDLLAEAQPTGHLKGVDLKGRNLAGEERYWRYFACRFETPEGPQLLSLIQDITQQTQLHQELELAQQVIENTSDGVMIADDQSRILSVNQAFTHITGYSREEAIGQSTRLCKSGRHEETFYAAMWQQIISKGHWSGEIWNRRKSGEVFPCWLSINRIRQADGDTSHYIAVFSDISQIKQAEKELTQLAYYDPLTALPNRALFRDRLAQEIAATRRQQGRFALFFIDLDRFKDINDSLGHNLGDQLLHEMACRLARLVRETDTAARLGGDEFTLIMAEVNRLESVTQMAERLLSTLGHPVSLAGQEVQVGASIGIALFPEDGDNSESLIQHADMAMYQAKSQGRNNFQFYTHSLQEQVLQRMALERELRLAIQEQQFCLYYQPQLDLNSGQVVGAEALVRWIHPHRGLVSPLDFIPLAEESGLIIPLGQWILEEACRQMRQWHTDGLEHLLVAVNLSARQFSSPELLDQVLQALQDSGLPPQSLELELTESMLVEDSKGAAATLNQLRELGVQLSIDDFGTGYSSLAYLKRFQLDHLKIDQGFVRDLTVDSEDAAIVKAIILMSRGLGLNVIAEGIETTRQKDFLVAQGCPRGQGYLFSAPLPADEFIGWLKRWQSDGAGTMNYQI